MGYTKEEIVLRTTTHSPLTVTGVPKTWIEEDNNWIILYEFMKAFVTAVAPYNPATTYPGGTSVYVSYDDNIWLFISPTDQTAVTPVEGAVWTLVSAGAMGHAQGTDQYIDLGGVNQSSANQIWSVINEQVISVTTALFITYRNGGFFKPNRIYRITDLGDGDLFVRALTTRRFESTSYLLFQCADYINYSVWVTGGTYAINDIAIWNNNPYKNLTGTNAGSPDTDGTNWVLLTSGAGFQFRWVKITFDNDLAPFGAITDDRGNEFYYSWMYFTPLGNDLFTDNKCDANSHIAATNIVGILSGNNLSKSSEIACDVLTGGAITNNNLSGGKILITGDNNGTISNNTIDGVTLQMSSGFNGFIDSNVIQLPIKTLIIRDTADIEYCVINANGSSAEDSIDITGLTYIDCFTNGYPDAYGIFNITSTNATETINGITSSPVNFPFKIVPDVGLQLSITCTAFSSASTNQFVSDVATVVLKGSKGDFALCKKLASGVIQIVSYVNNI